MPGGERQACRTVFLAGAECPFTCVFCDLWRYTLDRPTPPGALVRQLEDALADGAPEIDCLKLYNASNFFDPRAVPDADLPALAALVADRSRTVVECHPRLVGDECLDFARRLDGRLELALGLETAHPEALARLGKRMSLDDFDRACRFAQRHDLGLRAFVLIGAPFVPPEESSGWIRRSVVHALDQGVEHVALIPVRGGNGALEELAARGQFTPPTPGVIEAAFDDALEVAGRRAVVTLDLWDLDSHFAARDCCAAARLERLAATNTDGAIRASIDCPSCAGAGE